MQRSGPLPRVNRKRGGSRFPKRRDPKYCAWIRTLPCAIRRGVFAGFGCAGPVECAHVKGRGAGGDDRGNTFPACRRHHRQQHDVGIETFQQVYGLDLASTAAELALQYPGAQT